PELPAGYLGVARLLEQSGDPRAALTLVQDCRKHCAADVAAVQLQIKLLVANGRAGEATKVADAVLNDQAQKDFDHQAAAGREERANRQLAVLFAVGAGYYEAGAVERAETWLATQLPLVVDRL